MLPDEYKVLYSGKDGTAPVVLKGGEYDGNLYPDDILEVKESNKDVYLEKIRKSIIGQKGKL